MATKRQFAAVNHHIRAAWNTSRRNESQSLHTDVPLACGAPAQRAGYGGTVMAWAAWMSSRIDLQEDVLDMLPRNDSQVDEYRYALRKFARLTAHISTWASIATILKRWPTQPTSYSRVSPPIMISSALPIRLTAAEWAELWNCSRVHCRICSPSPMLWNWRRNSSLRKYANT
jgi:hypothetical protein